MVDNVQTSIKKNTPSRGVPSTANTPVGSTQSSTGLSPFDDTLYYLFGENTEKLGLVALGGFAVVLVCGLIWYYCTAPYTDCVYQEHLTDPGLCAHGANLLEPGIAAVGIVICSSAIWLFHKMWNCARIISIKRDQTAQGSDTPEMSAKAESEEDRLRNQKLLEDALQEPGNLILGFYHEREWDPYLAKHVTYETTRPVVFDETALGANTVLVASTKSGKTESFSRRLVYVVRRAKIAAIFLDPKPELNAADFDLNFSTGSSDSFRLCLIDPQLDPLSMLQQLSEAIIPANAINSYFSDTARMLFVAVMLANFRLHGEWLELEDIIDYANSAKARDRLMIGLSEAMGVFSPQEPEYQMYKEALQMMDTAQSRLDGANKSDRLGSLYNAIQLLAVGKMRNYLTTNPKRGITLREMLEKRLVVRIAFTADDNEAGRRLGKFLVAQFTSIVLSPGMSSEYLKLLVADEASNYVCPQLALGLSQAVKKKGAFVLLFQSLSQIVDEHLRTIVFANCRNRFVMAGVDESDAEKFESQWGKREFPIYSHAQGQGLVRTKSTGTTESNSTGTGARRTFGGNSLNGESNSQTQTHTLSHTYLPSWPSADINGLKRYHAVYEGDNEAGKIEPTIVRFFTPAEWEDINHMSDFYHRLAGRRHLRLPVRLPTEVCVSSPLPSKVYINERLSNYDTAHARDTNNPKTSSKSGNKKTKRTDIPTVNGTVMDENPLFTPED